MIFNTFEWLTLQVAFLPYPKNAETGRHHCLQNVFACKHACMQTQPAIWGCNCTAEDIAKYRAGNDEQDIDTYHMKNSYLPTSRHKRYLKE